MFSDRGTYLASAGRDGMAVIWDPATLTQTDAIQHRARVRDIAFASMGNETYLATASFDCTAIVLSLQSGDRRSIDARPIDDAEDCPADSQFNSVSFNEDGSRLLLTRNFEFDVVDSNVLFAGDSAQPNRIYRTGLPNKVTYARFDSQGDIIYAGLRGIRGRFFLGTQAAAPFRPQSTSIQRIELSANGTLLFSIDEFGEFRVTDLDSDTDLFWFLLDFDPDRRTSHFENNVVVDYDLACIPGAYSCVLATPLGTTGRVALYLIEPEIEEEG